MALLDNWGFSDCVKHGKNMRMCRQASAKECIHDGTV